MRPGTATVTIRLADAAQAFVEHALDLLEAVETSDPALLTDRAREAAEEFRAFIETKRGQW